MDVWPLLTLKSSGETGYEFQQMPFITGAVGAPLKQFIQSTESKFQSLGVMNSKERFPLIILKYKECYTKQALLRQLQ